MKRKALITGARPHPFEGPWVTLEEGSDWEMEGLRPGIRVEHVDGRARAIIEEASGDKRISVVAVERAA
ncbi:hypothetical protein LCGC14_1542120 [marine sediment metagenome]|uniref:Uncharacterized protein n=1 Tax=marine sediment metagenome TaxID=412755 RepID=A0A0F9JDQ6_9ZZZZ